MEEEFEIAESMNKFIIPVGFTKSLAQKLWKKFNENPPKYLSSTDFQQLQKVENTSEQKINESVKSIMNLIEHLNPQNG